MEDTEKQLTDLMSDEFKGNFFRNDGSEIGFL